MTLLGHRNWWAPAPLRQLHARLGLREAPAVPVAVVPLPAALALPVVVREPAEAA
jgi:RND superfamily putative drug exporter